MLSLDEAAVEFDFAAGLPLLPDVMIDDVGFGFDFDNFDFEASTAGDAAGGFQFDATTTCGAAAGGFVFDTATTACGAGGASSCTSSPVGAASATTTPAAGIITANAATNDEEDRHRRLKRKISNRESALAASAGAARQRAVAVRLDNARLQAEARALRRRLGDAQRHAVLLLAVARARLARAPVLAVPAQQVAAGGVVVPGTTTMMW